eukprot:2336693-Alexandrium_andersonii.AAC.1
MSASLVGSEMCIRDSSSTRSFTSTLSSTLPCESSPKVAASFACEPSSVSYTHLTLPTICSV